MIYDVVIGPIETLVEWCFLFITDKMPFVGVLGALVGVSVFINFLALPLYNVADSIKEKERAVQLKLQAQADRIKKAFKGDERFMMMQTMYRQNHYHPFYSLKSSLSILIEIPFFIAAYHYLSHNEILQATNITIQNTSPLTLNFGSPDHAFNVCGFYINVLPVLMTLINVVSSMIYSKGAPKKELVQLYGLSLVFLALLYNSPSGLVIYWICNNIFSLFKNVFQKSKYAKKIVYGIFALVLFAFCAAITVRKNVRLVNIAIVWSAFLIYVLVPFLTLTVLKKQTRSFASLIDNLSEKSYFSVFIFSSIALTLLLGFILPSSVVATSPLEFSCLGNTDSPFSYVISTLSFFTGFFIFWPLVIYKMFGKRTKFFLSSIFFVLFICATANVYIFYYDYGYLSQTFAFENRIVFLDKGFFYIVPPLLVALFGAILFLSFKNNKIRSVAASLLLSVCIGEFFIGAYKSSFIISKWNANKENLLAAKNDGKGKNMSPVFTLSNEASGKKNVVVIFLDRGINSFVPRVFEQFPEVAKAYDGFVWHKNSLSFGNFTTVGAPAMMAGYEYSPEKINKRSDELLRDKHNEASLVLPKLFLDAGWTVTITDPPLPNYSDKTDLSAFKQFPQIKVSELAGRYDARYLEALNIKGREIDKICKKQARNFCIIQALLPKARMYFYNIVKDPINETSFEHNYSSLYFFNELTDFNGDKNNYFFIENDSAHPDGDAVDWGTSDELVIKETDIKTFYDFKDSKDLVHYRVNALSLKAIAKWLDYLKENDAYNNTRIIIVSDHGRDIHLEDFETFADPFAPAYFSAMLLTKDFGAHGDFAINEAFMMNADTLFIAKEGLGLSGKNPFTGNEFKPEKDGDIHVYYAESASTTKIYDSNTFDLSRGWSVKENIFDEGNWNKL